eukprot:gnl/MRDRNA2_/MRDRNA2_125809_c0_seq1.p1 gnl/MRDRNA2_/MRDRNA2_125809_c0~~gnl/MRDRNA2_/MRDRNA2_125809_c0_seq1.p1  ORF type:complete len:110 (+),score=29.35 gnl/MRDRNA2_/MRDRNA2_125809_c0_seq1:77-406(+)
MAHTGLLKKHFVDRGFGFIERDDGGGELFLHFSQLTNGGPEDMAKGMKVTFDVRELKNGKREAINATILDGSGGGRDFVVDVTRAMALAALVVVAREVVKILSHLYYYA